MISAAAEAHEEHILRGLTGQGTVKAAETLRTLLEFVLWCFSHMVLSVGLVRSLLETCIAFIEIPCPLFLST